jgi:predicted pyridoxine 5'-phosphate oxidase superfamily flavin-nucleotide-binding protein
MALNRGIVPEARKDRVRDFIFKNYGNPGCVRKPAGNFDKPPGIGMPYTHWWLFEELFRADADEWDAEAVASMRNRWKTVMTWSDVDTLAEGYASEGCACHVFGSAPVYFLHAYVLGVRLDGPVWNKRLLIEPRCCGLTWAQGVTVTELGLVHVSWRKDGSKWSFTVEVPPETTAQLRLPAGPGGCVVLDGKQTSSDSSGRWRVVTLSAGRHTGSSE